MNNTLPGSIRDAYSLTSRAKITPITTGLINQTYLVEDNGGRSVIQQVNPIFAPAVHYDIEAITAHLEAHGMLTPRLLRTRRGDLFTLDEAGLVWRRLTYIDGVVISRAHTPKVARAAGALVAQFHRATATLKHSFLFSRPGAHDTPLHLRRLREALNEHSQHPRYLEIATLA